jgi:hypothetical protein
LGRAGEEAAHTVGSHLGQAEAIGRLEQLRKVVPVFAQELVSARRDAAQLRTENAWLHEQLRQGPGHPAESSQKDAQAALHRRDQKLGESQGRGAGGKPPPPRSGKKPKLEH